MWGWVVEFRLVGVILTVIMGIYSGSGIAKGNTISENTLIQAQRPDPNRDRFPQSAPIPSPLPPESAPQVSPTPTPAPTETPNNQTINVQQVNVTGNTIFSETELDFIIKSVEGKTVTISQLQNVADEITQLYLNRGYITSRAILVDQSIVNGIVGIRVIEGRLTNIEILGTNRLSQDYIKSRIQLGASTPLNANKLEDQLRLLRGDPLLKNIEASLRAGTNLGESILIVQVTEANPFQGSINFDNYSPPSIGAERYGINLSYGNLTGIGDRISGSYYRTITGGADIFDFSYQMPVNPMNGTVQFRAAPNRNKVTQAPFDVFDIRGQSDLYELSYRQPLIRSPREEFALSLGFAYQSGQTFTFAGPTPFSIGPNQQGISTSSVVKFGQDYVRRDVGGAWAVRSLFSIGTGLFDATNNPPPIPDANFISWLGQIQRVQVLNQNNFLIIQTDVQLTPNSLLPSQQFVIGGGQSLRGYRQNVRAGDNGVRFSIEDRWTLIKDKSGASNLQLAPFFDMGAVWNVADNPNPLPSQNFLAGIGLGLIWQPIPRLYLRLDYGLPLVEISDRGNNIQDQGLYFNLNYQL